MFHRKKKAAEVAPASPLRLSLIDGHVTYTGADAVAWFAIPTQRWAFVADSERLGLVVDMTSRIAALAGREIHVRVTSQPIDAARWAEQLAGPLTPDPLPGHAEHVVAVRDHLAETGGAVKRTLIGVRLATRHGSALVNAVADRVMGRPSHGLEAKVRRDAAIVAEAMAGQGIEGAPADPVEMEWLLRRSIELGMPAPQELSPVDGGGRWDSGDLHELTGDVHHEAALFSDRVKVIGRGRLAGVDSYVSVLTVGRVDDIEVPDPARAPWLAETDRLPFPVEWSMRLRVLDGAAAREVVGRKLLVIRDMQRHYGDHDMDEPLALERQAGQARRIEDEMSTGRESTATRVHAWLRVAVWGSTPEECQERVRQVADLYRKRQVTIVHPKGQYGLLREFIPGEPLSSTAYQRRLPALYFAAGVPQTATTLGDGRGPVIGHTIGQSRRSVMFDTHFSTEVRETSGLVPIVGGLGAGKSVLAGLIAYEAVRRGITSVMLDPSGPLARLTELPELRAHSRHIDLMRADAGTLNPFTVIQTPRASDYGGDTDALEEAKVTARQDRKLLALDVATMLLPAGLAAKEQTRVLLTAAVRSTRGSVDASLWDVVEHLEQHDGQDLAGYLRDMAEMPMARLFFPERRRGDRGQDVPDATLTVLTMAGLVLPPGSVPREHWSTSEQLAVPLLHLASWYATRTIYGRPRDERKLVALDETHFLGEWGAGRALFNRLGRDSRKWNTCVLAASQNPADVLGMDVSNFVSAAFVGRIGDEEVAADALRLLGVPTGVGYEAALGRLSPRAAAGTRSGLREFVMRDVDGNVDRMRVSLDHLPQVLEALDTTAAPSRVPSQGGRPPMAPPERRTITLGGVAR